MYLLSIISALGGLALFLYGMDLMGKSLERCAGQGMRNIMSKLTGSKFMGLLTGVVITAMIQSSSATTVMTVGFVNSGLMSLSQSINVIMGANVGTTLTAWILSLSGISDGNFLLSFLKPQNLTPIIAVLGIVLYMLSKKKLRRDTGLVLLGFAILMFGMERMSGAVSALAEDPRFTQLFLLFRSPLLGLLMGTVLTAAIQSSSASVGILQAFASSGLMTNGMVIPIILGQNIGTCVTTLLSSLGANRNAKRASAVHLLFNMTGAVFFLIFYLVIKSTFRLPWLGENATMWGIALIHSAFNVVCTVVLYPFTALLEKIVCILIKDGVEQETEIKLDRRLLETPPVALECCRKAAIEMAHVASKAIELGMECIWNYSPKVAEEIALLEDKTDQYEDVLSSYLVELNGQSLSEDEVRESAVLLKMAGDLERIGDHALELADSAEEMRLKAISFHGEAEDELKVLFSAVKNVVAISVKALEENSVEDATSVEPLEQVIDVIKEKLRTNQILRVQSAKSSMKAGFVWTDILTAMERTSDHCSNIAGSILDGAAHNMEMHKLLRETKKNDAVFHEKYNAFFAEYSIGKQNETVLNKKDE